MDELRMDVTDLLVSYEEDREKRLERRPVCSICGEHIQEDKCYRINDEFVCPSCLEEFEVWTEDYEGGEK
jgi:formylmethanofuran dehydrogenase subunit E